MSDELIVKYLLNEATEQEAATVLTWVRAQPSNARYYEDFKTIWDESRKLAVKSDVNTDKAWNDFQMRIASGKPTRAIAFGMRSTARIAAGLVLLIAGSILYFFAGRNGNIVAFHTAGSAQSITLPDGTLVTLNKASELRYPKKFSGNEREVALNGEAFFEVAHDKAHPFIITANEARVKVVGTSFNVKSSTDTTDIIVATGIVEVSRRSEILRLQPNEATTVYKGKAGMQKRRTEDALYEYYRTKEFVCNNTPLSRLAEVLAEAYNVQIDIPEPAVRDLTLTVTFRNESLPEVLRVISETLNISATKQDNKVVFKSR